MIFDVLYPQNIRLLPLLVLTSQLVFPQHLRGVSWNLERECHFFGEYLGGNSAGAASSAAADAGVLVAVATAAVIFGEVSTVGIVGLLEGD